MIDDESNIPWMLLQIAAGGALGALGRYLTSMLVARIVGATFPFGTLMVNSVGCLAMGFAVAWFAGGDYSRAAPFVTMGFLGGYTTMSAFALETWMLMEGGKTGEAFIYVAATLILSLAALAAGIVLGRGVWG